MVTDTGTETVHVNGPLLTELLEVLQKLQTFYPTPTLLGFYLVF